MLNLFTSNILADLEQGLAMEPSIEKLQQLADASPTSSEAIKWQKMMTIKGFLESNQLTEAVAHWDPGLSLSLMCVLSDFDASLLEAGYDFDALSIEQSVQNLSTHWIQRCADPNQHLGLIGDSGSLGSVTLQPNLQSIDDLATVAVFLLDDWTEEDLCAHQSDFSDGELLDGVGPWYVDANRKVITYSSAEFPDYQIVDDEDVDYDEAIDECSYVSAYRGGSETVSISFASDVRQHSVSQAFLWSWLLWKGVSIDQRSSPRSFETVDKMSMIQLASRVFSVPQDEWTFLTYT